MAGEAVAWFEIRGPNNHSYNTHGGIEICGNEQFVLGRDPELCRYVWPDDLTISRQHLRVHCILYDQDLDSGIAPFVYATNASINGTYLKKSSAKSLGSQDRGIFMGRSSTFLLNDGDEVQLSETARLIFHSSKPIQEVNFTPIQERERAIFARDYLITGRLLGEGGYGKVLVGIDQATQNQLACKIVKLDHLYETPHVPNLRLPSRQSDSKVTTSKKRWPPRVAACFREFDILKDLSHPNIVSIEKVFWSNNNIYIFEELVTGGDLFSFLEYKGGRLNNPQAAVVIRQVLLGLEYLHAQQIVHRDIKPDNILMTSLEDGARVVITDFGNARFLPAAVNARGQQSAKYQRMFSCVGTLEFAAPEIHKMNATIPVDHGYSKAIDMWSIGCITATVLTGQVIFDDRTHPEYCQNPRKVIVSLAAECDLSILDDEHHPVWSGMSHLPKDFIKRLLVLEEDDRMTATEALAHKWFSNEYYAAELEDLYSRSIRDWKPRPADSQLVERISKSLPDFSIIGIPGQVMSQSPFSHFFHPEEQQLTQNIMQTLSAARQWRSRTPLPSILDDYANEDLQFASQLEPSTLGTNNRDSAHQDGDAEVDAQAQYCFYDDEYGDTQHDRIDQNDYSYDENDAHVDARQWQETSCVRKTIKYVADDDVEAEQSHENTESLNNISKVTYFQRPHSSCDHQYPVQELYEQILVLSTPVSQPDVYTDSLNKNYQQTQYREEYVNGGASEEGLASVIVHETPPEDLAHQAGSLTTDLSGCRQWFEHPTKQPNNGSQVYEQEVGWPRATSRARYL